MVLDWKDGIYYSPIDIVIDDTLVDVRNDKVSGLVDTLETGVLGDELFFGQIRELVEAELVGEALVVVDLVDHHEVSVEVLHSVHLLGWASVDLVLLALPLLEGGKDLDVGVDGVVSWSHEEWHGDDGSDQHESED